MKVSWDYSSQYMENKTCSNPTQQTIHHNTGSQWIHDGIGADAPAEIMANYASIFSGVKLPAM
jgi:hypothetical protein